MSNYRAASEDTIYSHAEGHDEVARALLSEYAAHLNDKTYRQQWTLVPAGRLKKIWNDYAKLGFVRDEAGINKIADIIVTNIHKIEVNNILTGHTQNDPLDYAESITDERPPENYFDINESFFDDEHGSWRISDYAANALSNEALNLQEAKTAEDKLQIIDRILNIVHQRSDIAGWFVEGGTGTLCSLAGKTAAAHAIVLTNYPLSQVIYAGRA